MRKLLLVAALIALCALLEMPQDYEWTPDAQTTAMLAEHAVKRPVRAVCPEAMRLPEEGPCL
jgi:hypothetical protein